MHYCLEESRGYFRYREVLFDSLIQSIKVGQVDTAKYLLDWGEFDINTQSYDCQKGALFTVIHDCPPEKRPVFMKLVLDHGVDPNGIFSIIPRTPFQAAVKLGDTRSAATLVEYGADVHAASLLAPPALMMPLLLQAIEHRSAPLVELLLNNEVDRFCDWRRKRYIVHDGTKEGKNIVSYYSYDIIMRNNMETDLEENGSSKPRAAKVKVSPARMFLESYVVHYVTSLVTN
ncbi:hypothetical protein N7486_003060 [Penicillium sp. IBT 16267x]|nr:hypothetical protein N7486_003060 [Penicillium sp. IBT 16267x]